jgi:signal transduction histidine kinase
MVANNSFYKIFGIDERVLDEENPSFLSKENTKLVLDINKIIKKELEPITYTMALSANKILEITSLPIVNNNIFLGIVSIVKDITHEEVIKENFVFKHYQLKSLLENIPLLIYMQDKNMNYLTGTKNAKTFVEIGYDAFCGIHLNKIGFDEEEICENNSVINNNQSLVKEKEFTDLKGSPHWYKIYKIPLEDFDGQVKEVITLAYNIDSEKQLQAHRETFVASIGHDLKNPTIAQIRGLELLLRGAFGEVLPTQKEILEMLLDSCRYMNGMLSSLLATYRNNGGVIKLHFEEFSFCDLVMECVSEMLYVAKDKNVEISINSDLDNENIIADRVQIKRVIMNLLSNGIKYAFKNSTLNLSVCENESQINFSFENQSPYIPKEKQKSIFAQYVSYASAHNELGIGLGLYASKKIIEAHNGIIYMESFPENRNIFGFTIPRHEIFNNERSVSF